MMNVTAEQIRGSGVLMKAASGQSIIVVLLAPLSAYHSHGHFFTLLIAQVTLAVMIWQLSSLFRLIEGE